MKAALPLVKSLVTAKQGCAISPWLMLGQPMPRLFHAPTRTASSVISCYIGKAIRDVEQTSPCQEHSKVTPNTLRPKRYGRQFADNIFKCIFLDENYYILIQNPLKFVPQGSIDKKSALVQMMILYQTSTKSLPSGANDDPVH